MRLLRASPSWAVRICQDGIPTAWPTAQPILLNNFFLMSSWSFPSCCACVFSVVLSLGRVYFGLLCYCLSSRVQQFSSLSPPLLQPEQPHHSFLNDSLLVSCILCYVASPSYRYLGTYYHIATDDPVRHCLAWMLRFIITDNYVAPKGKAVSGLSRVHPSQKLVCSRYRVL